MSSQRTTEPVVMETPRRTLPGSVRWTEVQPPPETPRAVVELRALGSLEAVVAGQVVDLGAPKQRALLTLLASRVGQPVPVDVMVEVLWSGGPPPSVMTSLQAYVANLRKTLEPDRAPRAPARVLRTRPGCYLLDSRAVEVDVHRFTEHATAGWQAWEGNDPQRALTAFEAGLALWRGPAYAEVVGSTWVAPEVARLEELRLSAIEGRCAALLAVGAHERAVADLEAFIQCHPLREYGCELLSLALYRAGRQADALEVLRAIQGRLAEELGIDPRPALKHLEREILNQSPALDWQPTAAATTLRAHDGPPAAVPGVPSDPPPTGPETEVFVGRESQLRQLGDALAAARAGRGRVVTVSGEPGVGKTSLLRRFAEQAGVPVLCGACPEHVVAPRLWPWEQVLRAAGTRLPERSVPAPVAELLDGHAPEPADGAGRAGATLRRFEAIVRYLVEAADSEPLVVLLDHLHRADPGSLRLLAHLADSVPASRLLLVVAYRSDEAAVLAEALAALARAEMTRIELGGLDTEETRALAGAVLHRQLGSRTAEALRERTEGNPFYLRELSKVLTSEQRLEHPHTAPVPVPVREVVLRRVARLPHATAGVLAVAAVAGRRFDVAVVAEAASVEVEAALEGLDTAVAAGLVAEDPQRLGWFRFTHALVAETLYETAGRLRRARTHRRIGAAAARAWAGSAQRAAEVARHWLLAAELDPDTAAEACAHAATAARIADERHDPHRAAALWRQALTAADLADRADLDRYPLLHGLGAARYRLGDLPEGREAFLQAMEGVLAAPDEHGKVDTFRLVSTAVTALGEPTAHPGAHGEVDPRLVDVLERTRAVVTEPARRALVLACLAAARYHDGDPAGRATLVEEALTLARLTADQRELAHVLYLGALALHGPDHLGAGLRAVEELLALPGLPAATTLRVHHFHARLLITAGRVPEASAALDRVERHGEGALLRARLGWSRAGLLALGGRWSEADRLSRAAADQHAGRSGDDPRFYRLAQRWEAAFHTGGDGLVDELRVVARTSTLPALHSVLAVAEVEAGQVPAARTTLRRFPHPPRDHLWLYTRCWALLAAARLGERERIAQRRAQLLAYRQLTCSVLDVVIGGPVSYFTGEAALALGDREAALADFALAAHTARRMGAQPWLARVLEATDRARLLGRSHSVAEADLPVREGDHARIQDVWA